MIPKIIHYCWFGGPKSQLVEKCIESWKIFCPDYQIIEWNESNFDVNISRYTQDAYNNKKYAFVSDYFRVWAMVNYGGIYFDTDVELIKNIDDLLCEDAFLAAEDEHYIATGLGMGSKKGHPLFLRLLQMYDNEIKFLNENGELNLKNNPMYVTELLEEMGYSGIIEDEVISVQGIKIFPQEYFAPSSFWLPVPMITAKTYSIHHYEASWIPALFARERKEAIENHQHVFVSPHYDDVLGSCAGWMTALCSKNIRVKAVTLMSKKFEKELTTPLQRTVHSKWLMDDADRTIENRNACNVIACEVEDLSFFECIYRYDESGNPMYPNIGDEFDKVSCGDAKLIDEIYSRFSCYNTQHTTFYFPMAIGHQVDHVIVHEVGKRLCQSGFKVIFYEDFTYSGEINGHFRAKSFILSEEQKKTKIESLMCYKSQINMLFGGEKGFYDWFDRKGQIETYYYPKENIHA